MTRRSFALTVTLALLASVTPSFAEHWYRISSPSFVVVTNGSTSDGRRVADQLERLHAALQAAFPGFRVELPARVEVLAVAGSDAFQSLEPLQDAGLGKPELNGLWLPGEGREWMLVRLHPNLHFRYTSAEDRNERLVRGWTGFVPTTHTVLHPYAPLYRSYAALLIVHGGRIVPFWLQTGLAEFFEHSNLVTQKVMLGLPSATDLALLRTYKLIPLQQLFSAAASSPLAQGTNSDFFYAECWVVAHYLFFHRTAGKPAPLRAYVEQVNQGVDPVTAAKSVFGPFDKLQNALGDYIHGLRIPYLQFQVGKQVDEKSFAVEKISRTEADSARAAVLIRVGRESEAASLLARLRKANPNDARVIEDAAWLALQQARPARAEADFVRAAALDPGNFLPPYEAAKLSLANRQSSAPSKAGRAREAGPALDRAAAELQAAIRLNPRFAPAYDQLARLELQQGNDLETARLRELRAVGLDPANYGYRLEDAKIMFAMHHPGDVLRVLAAARTLAATPAERVESQKLAAAARAALRAPVR